jgi:hypothetical protein
MPRSPLRIGGWVGEQRNVVRQQSQNATATCQLNGPSLNRNFVDLEKSSPRYLNQFDFILQE